MSEQHDVHTTWLCVALGRVRFTTKFCMYKYYEFKLS